MTIKFRPRLRLFGLIGLLWILGIPAEAVDHNNIDAGRPLTFDDAEALAYRERALELGGVLTSPKDKALGAGLAAEFLYGFALNSHLSLDWDPSWGRRAGSEEKRFDMGDVGIGLFHNFNRELERVPAFALRSDVFLPTGRNSAGVEVRLRGIMSKALIQYDRIHVNVDGAFVTAPKDGERSFRPGMVLGYTKPLGYPRLFSRTGLADLALQSATRHGEGPILSAGVGLRQQITVRSVIDVGVRSDLIAARHAPRDNVRLSIGYSVGF